MIFFVYVARPWNNCIFYFDICRNPVQKTSCNRAPSLFRAANWEKAPVKTNSGSTLVRWSKIILKSKSLLWTPKNRSSLLRERHFSLVVLKIPPRSFFLIYNYYFWNKYWAFAIVELTILSCLNLELTVYVWSLLPQQKPSIQRFTALNWEVSKRRIIPLYFYYK